MNQDGGNQRGRLRHSRRPIGSTACREANAVNDEMMKSPEPPEPGWSIAALVPRPGGMVSLVLRYPKISVIVTTVPFDGIGLLFDRFNAARGKA